MGNLFHYDNPLIVLLTKVGNMILVSVFWLVSCIAIVTIVPATAALYHTTVKVVRGNGNGVARDFFGTLRDNFKQGAILSLLSLAAAALLAVSVSFGFQLSYSAFGIVYLMIGVALTVTAVAVVLFLPPTLSRFDGSLVIQLRLAWYFALKNPLRTLYMMVLLAVVLFACWFFPLLVLLLPGVYMDLICGGVEKTFLKYLRDNGLEPEEPDSDTQEDTEHSDIDLPGALELSAALEQETPDRTASDDTERGSTDA